MKGQNEARLGLWLLMAGVLLSGCGRSKESPPLEPPPPGAEEQVGVGLSPGLEPGQFRGGEGEGVAALLPGEGEVEGWELIPDTRVVMPTAEDLVKIYDGGYGRYRDAGVTSAAQQAYERGEEQIVLTVHRLSGPEEAQALYEDEREGYDSFSPQEVEIGDSGYVCTVLERQRGAFWQGPYYVVAETVQGKGTGAKELLAAVAKKIASD